MLELYSNIRKYRKELGLSQEELAKKTGYTDRSSIAKIEKGSIDLPQSKILLFAKALNVTPGELMGSVEEVQNNGQEESYYLDDEARELADLMKNNPDYKTLFETSRKLNKKDLQFVIDMIERFSD